MRLWIHEPAARLVESSLQVTPSGLCSTRGRGCSEVRGLPSAEYTGSTPPTMRKPPGPCTMLETKKPGSVAAAMSTSTHVAPPSAERSSTGREV